MSTEYDLNHFDQLTSVTSHKCFCCLNNGKDYVGERSANNTFYLCSVVLDNNRFEHQIPIRSSRT